MTGGAAAACLLAGLSLLVVPDPPVVRTSRGAPADARPVRNPRVRRAIMVAVGAGAVGVLLGTPWWATAALAAALGAVVSRIPVRPTASQRTAERQELAVQADLLAACLEAGMAIGPALLAVSQALAGSTPGGTAHRGPESMSALRRLESVAAMLSLGADPEAAWEPAEGCEELAGLAAAARRSATGGTTLAAAVREHAAGLRAAVAADAERSAGRAGVAMTAPLGVCFLPAFLCLGLAPVIIGLLGTLGIF